MIRRVIFLSIFTLFSSGAFAQDPIFSQFHAMPLQLNPAFAGTSFAPRFGAAYRNQWSGFNNAYRTYAVFYEQSIERFNSGIGFYVEGDNAGDGILKNNRFSVNYAYKLPLTDNLNIKIGVEAGLYQSSLDWDQLVFRDQIDPIAGVIDPSMEIQPDNLTRSLFDASTGILVSGSNLWFGYSLKHLTRPDESFNLTNNNLRQGLPLRHSIHAGTEITLKEGNKRNPSTFVSPNVLFASQGPFQQLNVGAYFGVASFFSGLWYRHTFSNQDAAIFLVGFREGAFKIGFSYDMTLSQIASISGGTFELTTGVNLDQDEFLKKKRQKAKTRDCMGLFE